MAHDESARISLLQGSLICRTTIRSTVRAARRERAAPLSFNENDYLPRALPRPSAARRPTNVMLAVLHALELTDVERFGDSDGVLDLYG
jgi:hypothetical protein